MPSPDLKRLTHDVATLADVLDALALRIAKNEGSIATLEPKINKLPHIMGELVAECIADHYNPILARIATLEQLSNAAAVETLGYLKEVKLKLGQLEAPCRYEHRPYPLQATHFNAAAQNSLPTAAWCHTHGWNCPNLKAAASSRTQSSEA